MDLTSLGAASAGGGGGQYQSTATAKSGLNNEGLFETSFGDFNVGGTNAGSGLKLNPWAILALAAVALLFLFRRAR